ncbi:MAG: DUF1850 domain-containing protein [Candidatus Accumulibacter sp.]|jgi:hypothetical protein|nr:DUF1850 domain-containing protein [Accumulibacter sp.]
MDERNAWRPVIRKADDERHGKRPGVFHVFLVFIAALFFSAAPWPLHAGEKSEGAVEAAEEAVLRIENWKTGAILAEVPARVGSRLFFGWIHSLEKIPWNEYFHVDAEYNLILDAITFPAFGAGIPEDKGRVCYVKDGLIHMEGIDQVFKELHWLNSQTATRDIVLDGARVASGSELPQHARLRLTVKKK